MYALWEPWIVGLAVLMAGAWLARGAWQFWSSSVKPGGCHGCGRGCGAESPSSVVVIPLSDLETLSRPGSQRSSPAGRS